MKVLYISLITIFVSAIGSIAEETEFFDSRDVFILQIFGFDSIGCENEELKDRLDLFFQECRSLKEIEDKLTELIVEKGGFKSKFNFSDNEAYGNGSCFVFSSNDESLYEKIELLIFRLPQEDDSLVTTFRFIRRPYCDEVFLVFRLNENEIVVNEMGSSSPYFDPWKDGLKGENQPDS